MGITSNQQAAQFEFARLAIQYYAAGRFAALSHCVPVAGNLLHHAVEMFLKGALVTRMSLPELKKINHNLKVLWNTFRQIYPDPALAALDSSISELEKFEHLRYPDAVVTEGMQTLFAIRKRDFAPLPSGPQPAYHLVLEDVDIIAKAIADTSNVNFEAYAAPVTDIARQFLLLHNEHSVFRR